MFESVRHLARLLSIGRTLVRYDALFPLETLDLGVAVAWFARIFGGRADSRFVGQRPGARLAAALQALGPSFIKLGQLLSTRPDLVGAALADDLATLRDRMPAFAAAQARQAIATELGSPVEALFSAFDERPIAAASIAQVHFAVTSDGRAVAVKVLRPGIERAFERDLALFQWLAETAERTRPALRRLRPIAVVRTLKDSATMEMDLRLEAAAASELAANFADNPRLQVPAVDWKRTAKRVLTSARVDGIAIDDREALIAAGIDLRAVAVSLVRVFLQQVFRDGFFHADLHHGNLFVTPESTIHAVDFGIMGRLDAPMRRFFGELLLAFLNADYRRAAELHFEAGIVAPDQSVDAFAQACRSIGEPILGQSSDHISIGRLLGQLFETTEAFAMETQPQLLLLQKTMVVVEGVARSLDPELNIWEAGRPVLETWARETLAPDAQLKSALGQVAGAARRFPDLVARAEAAAGVMTAEGLRLHPDSARDIAAAQARYRRPLRLLVWLAVVLLAVLLISQM